MGTKKQPLNKVFTLMGVGEIKRLDGEGVVIQGFANKSVVDRGNEVIATDAWDLENYKKNPVILYNHGFDAGLGSTPIGKAVEVTPTEEGLYIKAQLSKIDDPMINRVRGLVKEKILRAFSVGFNSIDASTDPKSGIKTISKAELFEVSIVGVPMNQDSIFELSGKSYKGALVAASIQNAIYEKEKNEGLKKDDMLQAIMDKAEIDEDMLKEILAGLVTPVPEAILNSFADTLGLNLDDLRKMDDEDKGLEGEKTSEESQAESEGGSTEGAGQGSQAEIEIEISQEKGVGEKRVGEESGEKDQRGAAKGSDFQQCVSDKISKLIKEGKEQDQAVAIAINMCNESGKCHSPTKKEYESFFSLADTLYKEKQADQPGVNQVTTEITTDRTAAANNDTGSPMLDAQKQTNVLLGALVAEIQKMSQKLDSLQMKPDAQGSEAQSSGAETQQAPTKAMEGNAEAVAADNKPENLVPNKDSDEAALKDSQAARSKYFNIEILEGSDLTFKEGEPQTLEAYGDPVNLKYPITTAELSASSRDSFKKESDLYKNDSSKSVVHSRIVAAEIALEGEPNYDESDPLDALLLQPLKDKLSELNAKALDSYRVRIENIKKRLLNLGV